MVVFFDPLQCEGYTSTGFLISTEKSILSLKLGLNPEELQFKEGTNDSYRGWENPKTSNERRSHPWNHRTLKKVR